jgi:hypothetical protein
MVNNLPLSPSLLRDDEFEIGVGQQQQKENNIKIHLPH